MSPAVVSRLELLHISRGDPVAAGAARGVCLLWLTHRKVGLGVWKAGRPLVLQAGEEEQGDGSERYCTKSMNRKCVGDPRK